jgi:hypothetical protein
VTTYPDQNALIPSIEFAGQDFQFPTDGGSALDKALREIDANPALVNRSIPVRGSPLNVALGSLTISVDGTTECGES